MRSLAINRKIRTQKYGLLIYNNTLYGTCEEPCGIEHITPVILYVPRVVYVFIHSTSIHTSRPSDWTILKIKIHMRANIQRPNLTVYEWKQ